jgi:hypothetical protein
MVVFGFGKVGFLLLLSCTNTSCKDDIVLNK